MSNISKEVKIFSLVTALSRFGFGFVEALIPIFLYDFSKSFSETGLFMSINQISILLLTPIIGILSNKISIKKIILIGIFFYFLTGLNYFIAGMFSLSIFIIFARLLSGTASSFISIGRQSCVYKYSSNKFFSENLGYFESITEFARVLPMFLGLFFVGIFPIYYLFLFICFFSFLAFLIGSNKLPLDKTEDIKITKIIKFKKIKNVYLDYFDNFKKCHKKILKIMVIGFLVNFIDSSILFAIPIDIYQNGASLKIILLIALVGSLPEIFGVYLGKICDRYSIKLYVTGAIFFIFLLFVIIFVKDYFAKVFFVLLFSILVKILDYVRNKHIHYFSTDGDLGTITGVNTQFSFLGSLSGPLIIGIIIDLFGFNYGIFFLIFILLVCLFLGVKYFKDEGNDLQVI